MPIGTLLSRFDEPLASRLRFLLEVDGLKSVIRGSRIADGSRRENTAEYSWHIALFALVLAPHHAAGRIDPLRVVSMLLIHDLVEIDCGDAPLFDEVAAATQAAREAVAAGRLFGLLQAPQATEFLVLWVEFEAAETDDARFAKAIDRLQPILPNHAVGGGTWTDYDVDETRERSLTRRIADGSPALWDVAEAVINDAVRRGWLKPAIT
ncbi:MAG: HD domain-containing protein [Bradyrhizobium sp.]|nr:HD domain-containing protein [Bradyrhizobium sp.]